jgi:hypothetical protein
MPEETPDPPSHEVIPGRPAYWSRQYTEPFTLDDDEARRIIETSDLAAVAWVTRSNEPVVSLIHYLWIDDYVTITTTPNRAKHRAWQRNPAASFCIWDPENPFKQVTLRGRLETFRTEEFHQRWVKGLVERRFSHGDPEREFAMFDSPDRRYHRLHIDRVLSYDGVKQYRAEKHGLDVWAGD